MKCSKVRMLLSAMLDGELGRSEEEAVLRHVEMCERCRRELEELRRLRDLVGALPSEPLPLRVKLAVLSAVGAENASEPMTCEEARQAMHLLLDGEAPGAVERALRAHLALCRECAREFEELRKGVELIRALPKAQPPAWVLDSSRYVERAEPARRWAIWPSAWAIRPAHAFAVATAVFAGLIALGVWRGMGGGPAGVSVMRPRRPAPTISVAQKPSARAIPAVKARVEKTGAKEETAREVAPVRVKKAPSRPHAVALRLKAVAPRKAKVTHIEKPKPRAEGKAAPEPRKRTEVEVAARTSKPASAGVPIIKRPAGASEEAEMRKVQKEEIRGAPRGPEAGGELRAEPAPKEKGPKVEVALGKGAEGIEILKFEF